MFELLYTSVSSSALSEADLIKILDQAQSKNADLGITGMLVYHNREIMQILEGDENKVKDLFQTIIQDNRHTSADVFYQGKIKDRAFSKWAMAYKALDENSIAEMSKDYAELKEGASPINISRDNPNRGKRMFLSLRDTL